MRHFATIAVRLLALLFVAVAPAAAAAHWFWPTLMPSIAFASVVGATAGVSGGFAVGARISTLFAFAAVLAVIVASSPVAAGLLVASMSALIAWYAMRGPATPMVTAALFIPYVIDEGPGPFDAAGLPTTNPVVNATLLFLMCAAVGVWGSWLIAKAMKGTDKIRSADLLDRQQAIVFGTMLAVFTGVTTFAALQWFSDALWMWVTLTIYVVTNPVSIVDLGKTAARALGTVVGSAGAAVILLFHPSALILTVLGILLVVLGLAGRITKHPYWMYAALMTPGVILMDAVGRSQFTVAEERVAFTGVGILIGLASGGCTMLVLHQLRRRKHPVVAAGT